jgi:cysteinyl-tRNA synthetase
LGILPDNLEEEVGGTLVEALVSYLLELRAEFRAAHQWEAAESVRDRLEKLGILLDEGPDDITWHLKG